ncbi:glycosyltransferase [SAR86 cluster bacterium]|nr:glycosyltransferase [SAR86 cluster bacterium]
MSNISVVTLCKDNFFQLRLTIESILRLKKPPKEIIIQDGSNTNQIKNYIFGLNNKLISYKKSDDKGIYDAMNMAKRRVKGEYIHYLNSGDWIEGDGYSTINKPMLFEVFLAQNAAKKNKKATFHLFSSAYCHQGIIFRANHEDYDLNYDIASDYNLIVSEFNKGVDKLDFVKNNSIYFDTTGLSSKKKIARERQYSEIILKRRPKKWRLKILIVSLKIFAHQIIFLMKKYLLLK